MCPWLWVLLKSSGWLLSSATMFCARTRPPWAWTFVDRSYSHCSASASYCIRIAYWWSMQEERNVENEFWFAVWIQTNIFLKIWMVTTIFFDETHGASLSISSRCLNILSLKVSRPEFDTISIGLTLLNLQGLSTTLYTTMIPLSFYPLPSHLEGNISQIWPSKSSPLESSLEFLHISSKCYIFQPCVL